MKIAWIGLLLLMAPAAVSSAAAADSIPAIEQAEQSWVAAITNKDFAALEKMLAPELTYMHASGILETKAAYIARQKKGEQQYSKVTYEAKSMHQYGNTAVVSAQVRMQGTTKGTPFNDLVRMLHVWVQQGGEWRLVAHQTTRLP